MRLFKNLFNSIYISLLSKQLVVITKRVDSYGIIHRGVNSVLRTNLEVIRNWGDLLPSINTRIDRLKYLNNKIKTINLDEDEKEELEDLRSFVSGISKLIKSSVELNNILEDEVKFFEDEFRLFGDDVSNKFNLLNSISISDENYTKTAGNIQSSILNHANILRKSAKIIKCRVNKILSIIKNQKLNSKEVESLSTLIKNNEIDKLNKLIDAKDKFIKEIDEFAKVINKVYI